METPRSRTLSDFVMSPRVLYISFLALIVGCAGAFLAIILTKMIAFFTNLFFYHRISLEVVKAYPNALGWTVMLAPMVGGILIGLMARFGSDKIRGHGIPEAMEAILIGKSAVSPKVAVLKPISAAISIGSGGPFGAEGPIIMTGGSVGSVIGQFLHLSAAERKILLLAGAAAGMCATFNAPIASVLFVVELLAFEMRPRSVMPISLAVGAADFIRLGLIGSGAMFPTDVKPMMNVDGMLIALLFGVVGPAVAYILTKLIYGSEDLFAKLPLHWMYWPSIGGLVVGIGGWIVPQVLGVGYDTIQGLAVGQVALSLALQILIVKSIVWIVALGSGTSGGILAPILIIGGTFGEVAGLLFHAPNPAVWALLGMAAVFAGVTRSPFTAVMFLLELTHDMAMLLPLTIACAMAAGLSALVLPRSILTEKIARRNRLVARDLYIDPLELHTVAELVHGHETEIPAVVSESETVAVVIGRLTKDGVALPEGFPVVCSEGRLTGYITQGDLWLSSHRDPSAALTAKIAELGVRPVNVITTGHTASEALGHLLAQGEERLIVIDEHRRPLGVLTASLLLKVRKRMAEEENERKPLLRLSWLRRPARVKLPARGRAQETG